MTPIEHINGYFANLNPVAEKIAFDIREVKSAYDHVWLTLSSVEQDDILNDSIIKPEISIRYYKKSLTALNSPEDVPRLITVDSKRKATKCQKYNLVYGYDGQRISTFIHQKVGLKIIHDESTGDYRDEHSYPFSYKTKSQINLSVIANNTTISSRDNDNVIDSCKVQVVDPRRFTPVLSTVMVNSDNQFQLEDENPKCLSENNCSKLIYFGNDEKCNILFQSRSKNSLLDNLTDSTDSENDTKDQHAEHCKLLPDAVQIPKGFDFLSNW